MGQRRRSPARSAASWYQSPPLALPGLPGAGPELAEDDHPVALGQGVADGQAAPGGDQAGGETKLEAVALVLEHGWSPAGEDPDERAVERLERTLLPALAELSPDQREVLLPRMAGGLTAPEVAAIVGKTTGAVKALQHRGLTSLARLLVSRGEDPS